MAILRYHQELGNFLATGFAHPRYRDGGGTIFTPEHFYEDFKRNGETLEIAGTPLKELIDCHAMGQYPKAAKQSMLYLLTAVLRRKFPIVSHQNIEYYAEWIRLLLHQQFYGRDHHFLESLFSVGQTFTSNEWKVNITLSDQALFVNFTASSYKLVTTDDSKKSLGSIISIDHSDSLEKGTDCLVCVEATHKIQLHPYNKGLGWQAECTIIRGNIAYNDHYKETRSIDARNLLRKFIDFLTECIEQLMGKVSTDRNTAEFLSADPPRQGPSVFFNSKTGASVDEIVTPYSPKLRGR